MQASLSMPPTTFRGLLSGAAQTSRLVQAAAARRYTPTGPAAALSLPATQSFSQQTLMLSRAPAVPSSNSSSASATFSRSKGCFAAAAAPARPNRISRVLVVSSQRDQSQPEDDPMQWPYVRKVAELLYGPEAPGTTPLELCSQIPVIADSLEYSFLHGWLSSFELSSRVGKTMRRYDALEPLMAWVLEKGDCTDAEHRMWQQQFSAGHKRLQSLGAAGTSSAGSSVVAAADRGKRRRRRLLSTNSLSERQQQQLSDSPSITEVGGQQQLPDDPTLAEVEEDWRQGSLLPDPYPWNTKTFDRQWGYIVEAARLVYPNYDPSAILARELCSKAAAIAEAWEHDRLHGKLSGFQFRATELRFCSVGRLVTWLGEQNLCTEDACRGWRQELSAVLKRLRTLASVEVSPAAPAAAPWDAAPAAAAAAAAAALPMPAAPTAPAVPAPPPAAAAAATASTPAPAAAPAPKGFDKLQLLRAHIAAAPMPAFSSRIQHTLPNTAADTAASPGAVVTTAAVTPGSLAAPPGCTPTAQDLTKALAWLCHLMTLLRMDHEPFTRCQAAMMQLQGLPAEQLGSFGPRFWLDYQVLLMNLHAPEAPTGCEDMYVDNVLTSLDRLVSNILAHEGLGSN